MQRRTFIQSTVIGLTAGLSNGLASLSAHAQGACGGLDQQQPQLADARFDGLRGVVARLHQAHSAQALRAGGRSALGDPAAFEGRVETLDEVGGDAGYQGFKGDGPSERLRIHRAVPADQPAQIARGVRAQCKGGGRGCGIGHGAAVSATARHRASGGRLRAVIAEAGLSKRADAARTLKREPLDH